MNINFWRSLRSVNYQLMPGETKEETIRIYKEDIYPGIDIDSIGVVCIGIYVL